MKRLLQSLWRWLTRQPATRPARGIDMSDIKRELTKPPPARDAVHYVGSGTVDAWGTVVLPGWYFWDETWADRIGPYDSEPEARDGLAAYYP